MPCPLGNKPYKNCFQGQYQKILARGRQYKTELARLMILSSIIPFFHYHCKHDIAKGLSSYPELALFGSFKKMQRISTILVTFFVWLVKSIAPLQLRQM